MDDTDTINDKLEQISGQVFESPEIAFQYCQHLLDSVGISLPNANNLPPNESTEIFPLGDDGEYYVYFSYNINNFGMIEAECQIIDEYEFNEIVDEGDHVEEVPDSDPLNPLQEDYSSAVRQTSRPASRWAKSMGLIYLGFGRYGDKDHNVKYIVKNNRLVPVFHNNVYDNKTKHHENMIEYLEGVLKDNEKHYGNGKLDAMFKTYKIDNYNYNRIKKDMQLIPKEIQNHKEELQKIEVQKKEDEARIRKKGIDPEQAKQDLEALDKKIHEQLDSSDAHQHKMAEKFETYYNYRWIDLTDKEKAAISHYTGDGSTDAIMHGVRMMEDPEYKRIYDKYVKNHKGDGSEYDFVEENKNNITIYEVSKAAEIYSNSKYTKELDEAIDAFPIPDDCILYSGLKQPFEKAENFKRNDKVHFSGYLSTTFDRNIAENFSHEVKRMGTNKESRMVIQIKAKKGQSGLYVGNRSRHPGEREMILPRNTTFKITAEPQIIKSVNGDWDTVIITCEIYDQP